MTDYRDDWKYSKPIPKEPARRAYEDGWERVFGVNGERIKVRADSRCPEGQSYLYESDEQAYKFFPPKERKR